MKTARFAQLVEKAGKPEPVTLWTAPEEDKEFSRAMRENRVLTIVQHNTGTHADYGLAGFFKEPLATYLIFPRAIPLPNKTKVIGIKYDQLAGPKPRGPVHKVIPKPVSRPAVQPSAAAPTPKQKIEKPPPPAPKLVCYRAEIEVTFRQVIPIEVKAASAQEAAGLVREKMAALEPNLSQGEIKRKASRPKPC